jgi:hypothetical protein
MQKLNRFISITSVASEITHLFCCGLPMVFSLLSLLSSLGLLASTPGPLESIHHAMHDYEIPMIIFAACLISFAWGLHYISNRIDCRNEGDCAHQPCSPKKKRSNKILIFATILFILNVTGYFVFHH